MVSSTPVEGQPTDLHFGLAFFGLLSAFEAFARSSRGDNVLEFFLLLSSKGIKSQYTGSFVSFVFHHIFNVQGNALSPGLIG